MLLNPDEIRKVISEKENENERFRYYLKKEPAKKVDYWFHSLNKKYAELINCKECANCCKSCNPSFTEAEYNAVCQSLDSNTKESFVFDSNENQYQFCKTPCLFLKENLCSIYLQKPSACSEYPYLDKKDMKYRLLSVFMNYEICPIVFNVVEEMKMQLSDNFQWKK